MCCFSQPVESVTDTKIFVRLATNGIQYLVYQMSLESRRDLALILPVPTHQRLGEKAVQFINLKGYPDFFKDLEEGFREPKGRFLSESPEPNPKPKPLKVHNVGNFAASFVPTVADFDRLDRQFSLPADTCAKLPGYSTYGFAVFKLKAGSLTVHPMAFAFRPQNESQSFFPTVHIHDGEIDQTAEFDHQLYLQDGRPIFATPIDHEANFYWRKSLRLPYQFMKPAKTRGIVDSDMPIYCTSLRGKLKNQDVFVTASSA